MQNSTQLRGIHQGMFTFAQSNRSGGRDGLYPGLDSGELPLVGDAIPARQLAATDVPGYAAAAADHVLPGEMNATPQQGFLVRAFAELASGDFIPTGGAGLLHQPDGRDQAGLHPRRRRRLPLRRDQHQLHHAGPFRRTTRTSPLTMEWKETVNTDAILLADRAIGDGNDPSARSSVWTDPGSGHWRGSVVRNDGIDRVPRCSRSRRPPLRRKHLPRRRPAHRQPLLQHLQARSGRRRRHPHHPHLRPPLRRSRLRHRPRRLLTEGRTATRSGHRRSRCISGLAETSAAARRFRARSPALGSREDADRGLRHAPRSADLCEPRGVTQRRTIRAGFTLVEAMILVAVLLVVVALAVPGFAYLRERLARRRTRCSSVPSRTAWSPGPSRRRWVDATAGTRASTGEPAGRSRSATPSPRPSSPLPPTCLATQSGRRST